MLKTVVALEPEGFETNCLVLKFEVPDGYFDFEAAVKAACLEFCQTEQGMEVFERNCRNFNWGDFDLYVPNEICRKYGFEKVETEVVRDVYDFGGQLVDEEKVVPEKFVDAEHARFLLDMYKYEDMTDEQLAVVTAYEIEKYKPKIDKMLQDGDYAFSIETEIDVWVYDRKISEDAGAALQDYLNEKLKGMRGKSLGERLDKAKGRSQDLRSNEELGMRNEEFFEK